VRAEKARLEIQLNHINELLIGLFALGWVLNLIGQLAGRGPVADT
jgi:uncharacterized membrane protein YuzA (DUF378 family)